MQRDKALKISLSGLLVLLLSFSVVAFTQAPAAQAVTPWDFPRLDELWMVEAYPYDVAWEKAIACDIDVYLGCIKPEVIDDDERGLEKVHGWNVSMNPGFHLCYHGYNCRDTPPDTAGVYTWFFNRTTDFELYPLNISSFRLALRYIVGITEKTDWIFDIYEYINVPQDFYIPPANEFWVNPYMVGKEYETDWEKARDVLYENGFTCDPGADGFCNNYTHASTDDIWYMPNGVKLIGGPDSTSPGSARYAGLDAGGQPMYGIFVASPGDLLAPTSHELSRRHLNKWNRFFMGVASDGVADSSNTALFIDLPDNTYAYIYFSSFYNRDHDIFMLCWGLGRNPDYLYDLFHPDMDYPGYGNSPGMDHPGCNRVMEAMKYWIMTDWEIPEDDVNGKWKNIGEEDEMVIPTCTWSDWIGPLPTQVDEDVEVQRCSKTGVYYEELEEDTDYNQEWNQISPTQWETRIHLKVDITLKPGECIEIKFPPGTYERIITDIYEMQNLVFLIQWKFYYLCPYGPLYSRNYINLFKPGLTCWVESKGYGSADSGASMPWTFASLHWEGQPVGGSLNWQIAGDVETLNPITVAWVYEAMIFNRMYDPLIAINPKTHGDMPWAACQWELIPYTAPNVPRGTAVKIWLRNDIRWQDGQPVTAEDVCWSYNFINATRSPEYAGLWLYYAGCEVINDELLILYINATGMWKAYDFMGSALVFPKQIWAPFYGNDAEARAFEPWAVKYEDWTGCPAPPDKPGLTCLFGTGPYWLDYWDGITTAHMYKNRDYWVRTASGVEVCTHNKYGQLSQLRVKGQCSKEIDCPPMHLDIYPPDISGPETPFTWPPVTIFEPVCTQWHDTYPECFCSKNYHLMNWTDSNGDYMLSPCDTIILEEKLPPHPNPGEVFECHVDEVTVTMLVAKKPLDPKPEEDPAYPFTVDNWKYLEYVGGIYEFNPEMPIGTQWHVEKAYGQERCYNQYCHEYYLAEWYDENMDGNLTYCDQIILIDKETEEWSEWHVEALKTNIVVSCDPPRSYEIPKITRYKDLEVVFQNLQKLTNCTFEYMVTCDDELIVGPVLVKDLPCFETYRDQPKLPKDLTPCIHTFKLYCRKNYTDGWSEWSLQYKKHAALTYGDTNCDSKVDIVDLVKLIRAYGTTPGKPRWLETADINSDGKVDIVDLVLVIKFYGTACMC